jgi:hypothetical protein
MFQLIRAAITREYTQRSPFVRPKLLAHSKFSSARHVHRHPSSLDSKFYWLTPLWTLSASFGIDVLLSSCLNLSDKARKWLPGTNPYQPAAIINS